MNQPAWTIRAATATDLQVVCLLAEDLAALHHLAAPSVFAPAGEPTRDEAHWLASITGANRLGLIAEVEGQPVGFVTVAVVDETHSLLQPLRYGRVNSISVTAAARGRGVGRALMAEAEAWARREGAREMRLMVWAFNSAALRMYEELGYAKQVHAMAKPLKELR